MTPVSWDRLGRSGAQAGNVSGALASGQDAKGGRLAGNCDARSSQRRRAFGVFACPSKRERNNVRSNLKPGGSTQTLHWDLGLGTKQRRAICEELWCKAKAPGNGVCWEALRPGQILKAKAARLRRSLLVGHAQGEGTYEISLGRGHSAPAALHLELWAGPRQRRAICGSSRDKPRRPEKGLVGHFDGRSKQKLGACGRLWLLGKANVERAREAT